MRKKFGQNFLINPVVRNALANALCAHKGDEIWEIGPGLGAMTAALLENGMKVRAFEIDAGFIRVLKRLFCGQENFCLVEGDVMKTWGAAARQAAAQSAAQQANFLMGNLPYNIAASLLADMIEKGRVFSRVVVTVQKEVALRMAASAGSPDYSSFSVLCSSVYRVKPLMLIHPSSFYPRPNVDSMGVLLEKINPPPLYPKTFYPLVRSLFASRRKTVKNNLSAFIASRFGNARTGRGDSTVKEICAGVLCENSLTGNERAETLHADVFLSIANSIENMRL